MYVFDIYNSNNWSNTAVCFCIFLERLSPAFDGHKFGFWTVGWEKQAIQMYSSFTDQRQRSVTSVTFYTEILKDL